MHRFSAPVHNSGAIEAPADLPARRRETLRVAAPAVFAFLGLCSAMLSRREKGTRRCRAGSPEEPALGSTRQGRGRGRNGGRRAVRRSVPSTS